MVEVTRVAPKENAKMRKYLRNGERLAERRKQREADRVLARDISKAWGRLTQPAESLIAFRFQIHTAAVAYEQAELRAHRALRRFSDRLTARA